MNDVEQELLIEHYGIRALISGGRSRWQQLEQRKGNVNWSVWYYGDYINGTHPELVGMPAYPLPPSPIIPPTPYVRRDSGIVRRVV